MWIRGQAATFRSGIRIEPQLGSKAIVAEKPVDEVLDGDEVIHGWRGALTEPLRPHGSQEEMAVLLDITMPSITAKPSALSCC